MGLSPQEKEEMVQATVDAILEHLKERGIAVSDARAEFYSDGFVDGIQWCTRCLIIEDITSALHDKPRDH